MQGRGSRRFPLNRGGTVVEHCRKYTVGHGGGRRSRPGYRPWSCGDRAGVLPTPAGGVVVAVGCSVLLMWHFVGPAGQGPAYFSGGRVCGGSGPPLDGVLGCTLGSPGDTWRSRTPRGGRSGTPSLCAERPSLKDACCRRTSSPAGGGSGWSAQAE